MPIIIRNDEPGAWMHVMNRAVGKRPFFETRADVRFFLSLVAHAVRRGWIEVHAFSILSTHFHMLVRSVTGQLDVAMAWIQSTYVRRFNRAHDRDGPLVKGRFTSKRVLDVEYRILLVGYIDWNPVIAGLVDDPLAYEHGSAVRLVRSRRPRWLSTTWIDDEIDARSDRGATASGFDVDTYRALFCPSPRQLELVAYRLDAPGPDLGTPDLVHASGPRVAAWLRSRARIADGDPHRPSPLLPPEPLLDALRRHPASDLPATPPRGGDPRIPIAVGLLRQLAGLAFRDIGARLAMSCQRAHTLWTQHCRRLDTDPTYARICATISDRGLRDTYADRRTVDDSTGSNRQRMTRSTGFEGAP